MDDNVRYKLEYTRWFAQKILRWIGIGIAGIVLVPSSWLSELSLVLYTKLRDWQPRYPRSIPNTVGTHNKEYYETDS